MVNWTPAIFTKLSDIAKKVPVEKRYNTYYIRGVALVQCNPISINITVKDNHLHVFYDPVLKTYQAYTMPIFQIVPDARMMFIEGELFCKELETLSTKTPKVPGTAGQVSKPSLPSNKQDADLDTILTRLNLATGKVQRKGERYYKAKDYVHSHYPECYYIVKYFSFDKPSLELLYSLYAKEWDKASSILNDLSMQCIDPVCVDKIGKFFDLCKDVISREGRE